MINLNKDDILKFPNELKLGLLTQIIETKPELTEVCLDLFPWYGVTNRDELKLWRNYSGKRLDETKKILKKVLLSKEEASVSWMEVAMNGMKRLADENGVILWSGGGQGSEDWSDVVRGGILHYLEKKQAFKESEEKSEEKSILELKRNELDRLRTKINTMLKSDLAMESGSNYFNAFLSDNRWVADLFAPLKGAEVEDSWIQKSLKDWGLNSKDVDFWIRQIRTRNVCNEMGLSFWVWILRLEEPEWWESWKSRKQTKGQWARYVLEVGGEEKIKNKNQAYGVLIGDEFKDDHEMIRWAEGYSNEWKIITVKKMWDQVKAWKISGDENLNWWGKVNRRGGELESSMAGWVLQELWKMWAIQVAVGNGDNTKEKVIRIGEWIRWVKKEAGFEKWNEKTGEHCLSLSMASRGVKKSTTNQLPGLKEGAGISRGIGLKNLVGLWINAEEYYGQSNNNPINIAGVNGWMEWIEKEMKDKRVILGSSKELGWLTKNREIRTAWASVLLKNEGPQKMSPEDWENQSKIWELFWSKVEDSSRIRWIVEKILESSMESEENWGDWFSGWIKKTNAEQWSGAFEEGRKGLDPMVWMRLAEVPWMFKKVWKQFEAWGILDDMLKEKMWVKVEDFRKKGDVFTWMGANGHLEALEWAIKERPDWDLKATKEILKTIKMKEVRSLKGQEAISRMEHFFLMEELKRGVKGKEREEKEECLQNLQSNEEKSNTLVSKAKRL